MRAVNYHEPSGMYPPAGAHLRAVYRALAFKLSAFLAAATHSAHTLMVDVWYSLRWIAEAFLETILPNLFFISLSLVSPDTVFSLLPRSTMARPSLPLAILLTRPC